jgi:hypothetical protein
MMTTMSSYCAYCRSPGADLFSPNGDPVCQACDSRFKTQILQHRADHAAAVDPINSALTFASPKTLFRTGIGLMATSVALGLVEVLFAGRVHVLLLGFLFVSGAAALWRGWD